MRLATIVVHHRNWPAITETLRSIEAQTNDGDPRVVVDSASEDGSVERIKSSHPGWQLVALARNRGYAAAVNAALALDPVRGADRVLVCTHEVILGDNALDFLERAVSRDQTVGAAGPVLTRQSDGSLWSAGGGLGRRTARPWHRQETPPDCVESIDVEWVDGAIVLYRGEALRETGLLDEGYFLYYEELDYHTRMRQAGWRVVVVPDATATQEPGMVPPYLEARNRIRWLRRSRLRLPLAFAVSEQVATAMRVLPSRDRRWEAAARLQGLRDGFTGRLHQDIALRRADDSRTKASSC